MGAFRFLHRWPALVQPDDQLGPSVPLLDDRDRELEDYLAGVVVGDRRDYAPLIKGQSDVTNPLTAGGRGTITFGEAFPTACATVVVSNGDCATNPGGIPSVVSYSATGFVYEVTPNPGAVAYRINWIAMGY